MSDTVYEIPFADFVEIRRAYRTMLNVTMTDKFYRIGTKTPAGHFSCVIDKNDANQTASREALEAMQPYWNKVQDGDIFDLWTHNFAKVETGTTYPGDWAYFVASGKVLAVDWFRGQGSNNVIIPADNPIHVVIFQSYFGVPFASWNGTRTSIASWQIDSNNPVESVQEYTRRTNGDPYATIPTWNGQVALDFKFNSLRSLQAKADMQDIAAAADDLAPTKVATTDYKRRRARLHLRSSLNERIEVYAENSQPYAAAAGAVCDVARVIVGFSRYPEF